MERDAVPREAAGVLDGLARARHETGPGRRAQSVAGGVTRVGDRDDVESLCACEHDLGLVGDGEVRTAGGDLLDRR